MTYGLVYCVTNIVNGKKYVGQTTYELNKRWIDHISASKRLNYPFYKAIRKYGRDSFNIEILCECFSLEELNNREVHYVNNLNSWLPNGYNCRAGGSGGKDSKETRNKKSLSHIGEKNPMYGRRGADSPSFGIERSSETREKISNALKGKYSGENHWGFGKSLSNEHRQKLSESRKGLIPSEETKKKRSKSMKARGMRDENHPCFGIKQSQETINNRIDKIAKSYKFISPSGKVVSITNLSKFCREKEPDLSATSMSKVWLGKRKSHKGWTRCND